MFEALATELTITCGLQPSLLIAMYARIAGAGVAAMTITFAPEPLSLRDLGADVRVGDGVARGADDPPAAAGEAEALLDAGEDFLAVVVVLVEDRDLLVPPSRPISRP